MQSGLIRLGMGYTCHLQQAVCTGSQHGGETIHNLEHLAIVHGSPLDGVMIRTLDARTDERGWFMEVFQDYWNGPIKPVQWSLVQSRPGVLRGLHMHLNHDEYFMAVSGEAYVGLRDLRPYSPTRNRSCMLRFSCDRPTAVLFPRGLLHGWCFTRDTLHLQAVSESYRDYNEHDNLGCLWSDPDLDIPWPVDQPLISERAQGFPSLAELERLLEPLWRN
jgi:dTDP-4-dehydrorhamnose 3,5-epimerase